MSYVKINNIKFKYDNSSEDTLRDFSLEIDRGEIIAVIGESGSGKSTLLRILSGFEVPYSGSIKVDNRVLLDDSSFIPVEKRGIGMVFQDYALFPHLTVDENIRFGVPKYSKKEQKNLVDEMLSLVNLSEYKKRYPHELSGGQQQRIGLARALAPKPSLLLLDEPFSNLDSNLRHKIRDELKAIISSTNTTALFVSHDREDALTIADRVVVLDRGSIVKVGKPIDVIK